MSFLVGAERSGTTLLRFMLNGHPLLGWRNEFEYAVAGVTDDGKWPPLESYYRWLSRHRVFQASRLEIDKRLDYPDLVRSFLAQTQRYAGKPRVGATVHYGFEKLPFIWPDALFIHIVRDVRDVARSNLAMAWSGNVWTATERWIEAEMAWDRLCASIPASRRLELKYEELVAQTVRVLERICAFIGIPYDPAMLEYPRYCSLRPPDPTLIGRWRTTLSQRDVELIESRAADVLLERGYALSGLKRIRVEPWMRWRLRLDDRWGRIRARTRRYGLSLVVSDFLSRRLGLEAWQEGVSFRLNALENAHIDPKPCCYDAFLRLRPRGIPASGGEDDPARLERA